MPWRLGAVLGAVALASVAARVAAEPPGGEAPPAARPRHGAPEVEEITVTGSHLRGAPTDGPSPVDVLGREEVDRLGVPRLQDALDRLPYNTGNYGRGGDVFTNNDGEDAGINLRGLGQSRTLILLDGRRSTLDGELSGGGNPFVTIQQFPKILIDRVEILKEGGAATYGSDAIAGVVNFVTRRGFEGLEVRGDYLTTAESSPYGSRNLEALYGGGTGDGRTRWTLAGAYYEQEKLASGQRGFTNAFRPGTLGFGESRFGNPGAYLLVEGFRPAGDVSPGRPEATIPLLVDGEPNPAALEAIRIPPDEVFAGLTEERIFAELVGLDRLGATVVRDPDCERAGGQVTAPFSGNCGYAFAPFFDLAPALKRYNAYAQLDHELSERVEVWADAGFYREEVDKIGVSPSFPILLFDRDARVPAHNPGNFLGHDLTGRFRPLARRFGGIGDVRPEADAHSNVQRYAAGLRADLPEGLPGLGALGRRWRLELSALYNRQVDDGSTPDQLHLRWNNALFGYGGLECPVGDLRDAFLFQGVADPDGLFPGGHGIEPGTGGCEYWNPFGNAITDPDAAVERERGGEPLAFRLGNSQRLWRWFSDEESTNTTTSLAVYDWLLAGELVDLPAGPLELAVGMQWREERYDVSRNAESIIPPGGAPSFLFLQGGDVFESDQDVWSLFGELSVPLHERADLQLAVRHEDYGRNVGKSVDPKLALAVRPTGHLTLRTSLSTTFRAPSLSQQRSNRAGLALFFDRVVSDPAGDGFGSGDEAVGLAFGWKATDTAGNMDLRPEQALVYNAGVVGRGFPVDGLDFAVDYYRIALDDVLGTRSPTQLLAFENGVNVANGFGWPRDRDPFADDRIVNATGERRADDEPGDGIPDSVCVSLEQVDAAGGACFYNDPRITRLFSTGELFRVAVVYDNFSSVKTDGVDVSASWTGSLPGALGEVALAASGSHIIRYDVDGGGADLFSGHADGSANGENFVQPLPKFKLYVTVDWRRGPHAAYLSWNHVSPYENDNQCGGRACGPGNRHGPDKISQWTTVDVGYAYDFAFADATLRLGIRNVFGQDPPFVPEDLNYDSRTHDPYGRKLTANLVWRWGVD